MYKIKETYDQQLKIYTLMDTNKEAWIKVAPERGGIIFSYGVEGEELLFLNKETFYNIDKNVRGGIPILFPISGQLTDGSYEWNNQKYIMGNHGFARNSSWEVIDTNIDNRASLTIRLTSNEATRASFPFDFQVIFTYILEEGKLTIEQEYLNLSNSPMPMYAGFHPYFKTSDKHLFYSTDATTYLDYNDGNEKSFSGSLDSTLLNEAVVLLDQNQMDISFYLSAIKKKIKLTYDKPFRYVMIWTEKDQDFICVEPWMAKTDEFNRKEELIMINSKERLRTELRILLD